MSAGPIRLGPFVLEAPLGRGGMSEVWRATHERQRVAAAVKIVTAPPAQEALFRAAFKNEVQVVARLDHPNIVMLLEHGETTPATEIASKGRIGAFRPYLAMELVSGGALDELDRSLTWPELRYVALSLLDALAHAHARGVLHRDLKPANVLIAGPDDPRPGIKLSDFGIAHALERERPPGALEVGGGTPLFMAPEQFDGAWRDYGPWTDLYALACLLWQLATGDPLFRADSVAALAVCHLKRSPPPFFPRHPVPAEFEAWLLRALMKLPHERWARAADAAFALEALDPHPPGPAETLAILNLLRHRGAETPAFENRSARPPPPPLEVAAPPWPPRWQRSLVPAPRALVGAGLGLFGLRTPPLVGRERERDVLWRLMGEVRESRKQRAVLLQGPAGTGKSRLAEWLTERADEVGGAQVIKVLHDPADARESGLPRALARLLRAFELDPAELRARLDRLAQHHNFSATSALAVLTADDGDERHGHGLAFLGALAQTRPLVVWLDDVHWGKSSLAFTLALLESATPAPILVVMTARDEALAERPVEAALLAEILTLPSAERLSVAPLAPELHRRLVEDLLGLEPDLAAQVARRTAGNPLFVVQLVGDWIARGALLPGPKGLVLSPGESSVLPDGIHEVWVQRLQLVLDEFPAGTERVLELLAILGREVDRGEWAAVAAQAGLTVPAGLIDTLTGTRLLIREGSVVRFGQSTQRESLERQAKEAGRYAAHHRAAAQALLALHGSQVRGVLERVGRHHLAAGDFREALGPLLLAAEARLRIGDALESEALLRDHERALRGLGARRMDPRWSEAWLLRAKTAQRLGDREGALRWVERAVTNALAWDQLRVRGDALRLKAALEPDPSAALEILADAKGILANAGDPRGVARCHLESAGARYRLGNLAGAADLYLDALSLLPSEDPLRAQAWAGLARIAVYRGDLERARDFAERALTEAGEDRWAKGQALAARAAVARFCLRLEPAEQDAEQAAALLGNDAAPAWLTLGAVILARGQVGRAAQVLARSSEVAAHILLTTCALAAGKVAAAEAAWAEASRRLAERAGADPEVALAADALLEQARDIGHFSFASRADAVGQQEWALLGLPGLARDTQVEAPARDG